MEQDIIEYICTDLLDTEGVHLTADDDLLGSGLISSLAVFRLIQYLETSFGIRVPPEEMTIDHFINVTAISAFVRDRQLQQQP